MSVYRTIGPLVLFIWSETPKTSFSHVAAHICHLVSSMTHCDLDSPVLGWILVMRTLWLWYFHFVQINVFYLTPDVFKNHGSTINSSCG